MAKLFTTLKTLKKAPLYKEIIKWEAPDRYWIPRDRVWYLTYTLFFLVLIAFFVLIGEGIVVLGIIAFAFLWFVQASVKPMQVEHVITDIGIKTFDKIYKWKDIKYFWFSEKKEAKFLNLDLFLDDKKAAFQSRISLLIDPNDDKVMFNYLIHHLQYGDREEISFNPLTYTIYGNYLSVKKYIELDDDEIEVFEIGNEESDEPMEIGTEK